MDDTSNSGGNSDDTGKAWDSVTNPRSYADWNVEQALADAVTEKEMGIADYGTQTRRHLEQAAPAAARSIINLALYSTTEKTRLDAAKYIVDRQLGRIGDEKIDSAALQPLEALLADVVTTAERLANNGTAC